MDQMTPRERVLTSLSRKETDKTPFSLGFGKQYLILRIKL